MCFQIAAQGPATAPEPSGTRGGTTLPHSNFRARGCSRTPEPCTAHTRECSVPSARWPFRTEMRPKDPSGTKSRSRKASAQPGRTAGKRPAEGSGGDRKRETGTAETDLQKGCPPEEAMPGPACFHFRIPKIRFFSARCGMFRTFNHIELIINKISLQSHAVFSRIFVAGQYQPSHHATTSPPPDRMDDPGMPAHGLLGPEKSVVCA